MTRDEFRERLNELHAERIQALTWNDLLTEKPDAPLSENDKAALDVYFSAFVATPKNDRGEQVCLCCRHVLRSGIDGFFLGGAPGSTTLEWSIAHGEAHCRTCHWPYRVYHRNVGVVDGAAALIEFLNVALAVHPSQIELTTPVEAVSA